MQVTLVHPGGIKTNIARNARVDPALEEQAGSRDEQAQRFERIALTSPEKAARSGAWRHRRNIRRAGSSAETETECQDWP